MILIVVDTDITGDGNETLACCVGLSVILANTKNATLRQVWLSRAPVCKNLVSDSNNRLH